MRVSGLLHVIAVVACLSPLTSMAQTAAQRRAAASLAVEEQTEPFHKHRDTRHGHDHYYPDRGAIVRDLPVGTIGTSYAGVSYRYHDGIWLEPRGPAYMVVSPPIGLIAPTLPLFSTVVAHGAESFLYCNDAYYRPRPDLGGYEVVNDPAMEVGAPAAAEALVGGQMPAVVAAGGGVGAAGAAGGAMPGVGAAAASVPAPSLGAGAGSSAPAAPAAGSTAPAGSAAAGTGGTQKVPKVFLYPRNGQSADQQARDRYDCYRFAVGQSGFDPLHPSGSPPGGAGEQQSDFERAQSACFEARGYSSR